MDNNQYYWEFRSAGHYFGGTSFSFTPVPLVWGIWFNGNLRRHKDIDLKLETLIRGVW